MKLDAVACPFPCGPSQLVDLINARVTPPAFEAVSVVVFDGRRCALRTAPHNPGGLRVLASQADLLPPSSAAAVLLWTSAWAVPGPSGPLALARHLGTRVAMLDALVIMPGAWFSLMCDDGSCCDRTMTPIIYSNPPCSIRSIFRDTWERRSEHEHRQPGDQYPL